MQTATDRLDFGAAWYRRNPGRRYSTRHTVERGKESFTLPGLWSGAATRDPVMLKTNDWFGRKAIEANKHVKLLRVRFTPETGQYRQSKIVAGQLRMLALNTDGVRSVAGAFDVELVERGMRFGFTSTVRRDEFKGRIQNYLSRAVTSRLTFSA